MVLKIINILYNIVVEYMEIECAGTILIDRSSSVPSINIIHLCCIIIIYEIVYLSISYYE